MFDLELTDFILFAKCSGAWLSDHKTPVLNSISVYEPYHVSLPCLEAP